MLYSRRDDWSKIRKLEFELKLAQEALETEKRYHAQTRQESKDMKAYLISHLKASAEKSAELKKLLTVERAEVERWRTAYNESWR